ncbi:MAG: hypothetical protein R3C10_01450 [Pirellulales bacterium]
MYLLKELSHRDESCRLTRGMRHWVGAAAALVLLASTCLPAGASSIYGTLSNFDIYNTTPEPAEAPRLNWKVADSSSIGGHFPSHFDSFSVIDYNENGKTGACD